VETERNAGTSASSVIQALFSLKSNEKKIILSLGVCLDPFPGFERLIKARELDHYIKGIELH
jgi:hypothetical protein